MIICKIPGVCKVAEHIVQFITSQVLDAGRQRDFQTVSKSINIMQVQRNVRFFEGRFQIFYSDTLK